MITITLTPNRPKKEGTYIVLRPNRFGTPEICRIVEMSGKLEFFGWHSVFPLSQLEKGALFSEPIEIVKQ